MRFTLLFVFTTFFLSGIAQNAFLKGRITDAENNPIEGVIINNGARSQISEVDGSYQIEMTFNKDVTVVYSKLGYISFKKSFNLDPDETRVINITLQTDITELREIDLRDNTQRMDEQVEIGKKEIEFTTGPIQGVEGLIRTLPGVVGTNEFSSQYNVRGGNFDENLVYVNGIEVYRPFLVRAGQQEGQSFINPDMVENIFFSAGGFDAKYGDKMSSVLDINYKDPQKFGVIAQASLLGLSVTAQGISKDRRFSALGGYRYKTNRILLGSVDTQADFVPVFQDFQLLLKYYITNDLTVRFFGTLGKNEFNVIPESRQTDFGTFNEALRLSVFFEGQEKYNYTTNSGALSFNWELQENLKLEWITSAFQTREQEYLDVIGYYRLGELDNNLGSDEFGEVRFLRGVGGFQTYGRNELDAIIVSTQIKSIYENEKTGTWLFGLKYRHEDLIDRYKEWENIDSAGYSVPHDPSLSNPGVTPVIPADGLRLFASYDSRYNIQANRVMAYVQNIQNWKSEEYQYRLSMGIRSQYYSLNGQTTISPRAKLAIKPLKWENDWAFRVSAGWYHQPPFYREMRNWEGELITSIKAQEAIHFVLGSDRQFTAWGRPFKWVTEVYYKKMNNLVPYEIENVRIRYYPELKASGYSAGVDLRVNGEFVKGIDSWGSLSIFSVKEDIEGDGAGFIPRPTDNRFSLAMYFQDYLPADPSFRVSLSFTLVGGFPFGAPKSEPSERVYRSVPYRRVDLGFIKVFKDPSKTSNAKILKPFETCWISLEVFNLLGTNNVASYLWVRDATTRGQYAVPNYLTGRLLNLKLYVKF